MLTIGSSDTLIIKTRMANGAVYTVELLQMARTDADIQQYIDTVRDDLEQVIQVIHLIDSGSGLIALDITDRFDVRSIEEVEEASRRARYTAARLQRQYGTLNHAQQGIAR